MFSKFAMLFFILFLTIKTRAQENIRDKRSSQYDWKEKLFHQVPSVNGKPEPQNKSSYLTSIDRRFIVEEDLKREPIRDTRQTSSSHDNWNILQPEWYTRRDRSSRASVPPPNHSVGPPPPRQDNYGRPPPNDRRPLPRRYNGHPSWNDPNGRSLPPEDKPLLPPEVYNRPPPPRDHFGGHSPPLSFPYDGRHSSSTNNRRPPSHHHLDRPPSPPHDNRPPPPPPHDNRPPPPPLPRSHHGRPPSLPPPPPDYYGMPPPHESRPPPPPPHYYNRYPPPPHRRPSFLPSSQEGPYRRLSQYDDRSLTPHQYGRPPPQFNDRPSPHQYHSAEHPPQSPNYYDTTSPHDSKLPPNQNDKFTEFSELYDKSSSPPNGADRSYSATLFSSSKPDSIRPPSRYRENSQYSQQDETISPLSLDRQTFSTNSQEVFKHDKKIIFNSQNLFTSTTVTPIAESMKLPEYYEKHSTGNTFSDETKGKDIRPERNIGDLNTNNPLFNSRDGSEIENNQKTSKSYEQSTAQNTAPFRQPLSVHLFQVTPVTPAA